MKSFNNHFKEDFPDFSDISNMSTQASTSQMSKRRQEFVRMIFGGISCITAATVTHPIDTIKIRLQIQGEAGR
jgi:Mitochondrial carrier protein